MGRLHAPITNQQYKPNRRAINMGMPSFIEDLQRFRDEALHMRQTFIDQGNARQAEIENNHAIESFEKIILKIEKIVQHAKDENFAPFFEIENLNYKISEIFQQFDNKCAENEALASSAQNLERQKNQIEAELSRAYKELNFVRSQMEKIKSEFSLKIRQMKNIEQRKCKQKLDAIEKKNIRLITSISLRTQNTD